MSSLGSTAPMFQPSVVKQTSRMAFRGNAPAGGVKTLTFGKKPAQ